MLFCLKLSLGKGWRKCDGVRMNFFPFITLA